MKKIKFMGVFVIFLFACIFHFGYSIYPNAITSILFPFNESIWEHMKLLITPVYLFSIIENIIYKKRKIINNNFLLAYGISIILGICIYLGIYLVINYFIGYNAVVAILLLLIIYVFMQYISYEIMLLDNIKYNKILGIIILIGLFIVFAFFTYYPLDNYLFFYK